MECVKVQKARPMPNSGVLLKHTAGAAGVEGVNVGGTAVTLTAVRFIVQVFQSHIDERSSVNDRR